MSIHRHLLHFVGISWHLKIIEQVWNFIFCHSFLSTTFQMSFIMQNGGRHFDIFRSKSWSIKGRRLKRFKVWYPGAFLISYYPSPTTQGFGWIFCPDPNWGCPPSDGYVNVIKSINKIHLTLNDFDTNLTLILILGLLATFVFFL